MTRIVCVSDTHTCGRRIAVPDGDILLHAGDLTLRGTECEIRSELDWLASLPHKHKVFIAGNHDWYFDPNKPYQFRGWLLASGTPVKDLLAEYPTLTYLQDSSVVVEGFTIYGSPWQPYYYGWAFNYPQNVPDFAETIWSKIPLDTEILLTHGPPHGILDSTYPGDTRAGCPELLKREIQLPNLKLHVFGHLHESYGREDVKDKANPSKILTFVNAAINTREYVPSNEPIVVDLIR
jgi:calcineurin-like phosphoesterase family protein